MSESIAMNEFLSKENISNIYKSLVLTNELNNLSKQQKDNIINQLINVMKKVYKTLDISKINKTNLLLVKKQFNDIAIKQTNELIKNNNTNNELNNRQNERNFNSVKRPVPIPGVDRPHNSFVGNPHGPAPPSVSADFMHRATQDVGTRLAELENSRRTMNEKQVQPDIPDFLKPVKVGKTNEQNIPGLSSSNTNSKPLLGFNTDIDDNFSSSVPKADKTKYNEGLSTQDRLKQLEMERNMPVSGNNPPPPSNLNVSSMFNSNNSNQNMFNQPPSLPQYNQQPPPQYNQQPPSIPPPQYNQQPPPQYNQPPPPNNQINDLTFKINEMQQIIINLKKENEILKNQTLTKKQTSTFFQLEVNKKDASYNFQFNPIKNIASIKLASYNLPQPVYNIIDDCVFKYKINGNDKIIYIHKGSYNIETLLNVLNNNTDDMIFSVDISHKISIKNKDNISFQLIDNNLTNKLGFIKIPDSPVNILIADRIYDLRPPNKLLLFLKNIYPEQPIGILNFNGTSVCDLQFNPLISLNNLMIEFYTENNVLYNFNDIPYNLSFIIEIM
jgi:hypothetical protein